ncbi:MAG: ComEC/Rec2 family competence protein, partial [Burkholderiaceae bacterium]
GAATVLAQQPQAQLLSSLEPDHPLQALRPSQRCEAGQQWEWDGVTFTVLHPLPADYGVARTPNALSCVLRISNGIATALLTGDIEKQQEERLVTDAGSTGAAGNLKADILLVPHHGSKTSSSPEFLDAVAPALAVVQSGYRNRFAHPSALVMERYRERHIAVLDSPHCGALIWRSERATETVCQREVARRVWHHRIP